MIGILLSTSIAFTAQNSSKVITYRADHNMVQIQYSEKDFKPWVVKAAKELTIWYPKIAKLIGVKQNKPTQPIVVVIKTHGNGVAGTMGHHIEVNGDYLRGHMNDVGMIVHEETHVVQAYPTYKPWWLVEGIADWVRWFHYEPKSARPHVNPATANYNQGYQVTASFLYWANKKYDHSLVKDLSQALQANKYSKQIWVKDTGKSINELWSTYIAQLKAKQGM